MRIISSDEFRKKELSKLLKRGKDDLSAILNKVKKIIVDVKEEGDAALLKYTLKFDKAYLNLSEFKVSEKEIKEAYKKLEKKQINALKKVAENIALFHSKQLKAEWNVEMTEGVKVGQVIRPLDIIGIYTPGGKGAYPSSLLMCAIPAKVAGVEKIVACSPPQKDGNINSALLVAADIAEINEFYKIGGAQAIAAMAYGTDTVKKVDKIVGPGNIYVTAAKLEVNKDVAIDIPAGPSEIIIIADETANASFIAADLLAQAEHDPQAWSNLLTTSKRLAVKVKKEIEDQMQSLSRIEIIKSSIQKGLIIIVKDIDEAIEISNLIAPEHLQIQTKSPEKIMKKIRNAGAIFLGKYSPVSFGDYSSGLNHVLPTAGYAKIYSGLSSLDFVKTINFLKCTKTGYQNLKETTVSIAKMEGFDAHSQAVTIREDKEK
ncbi:histidinol dehydrogenase [Candidatus Bathyarchaeota archaeon]|nr:histidinol dehydrogenase [Candidatus Bathyarchaeota archaeon]